MTDNDRNDKYKGKPDTAYIPIITPAIAIAVKLMLRQSSVQKISVSQWLG